MKISRGFIDDGITFGVAWNKQRGYQHTLLVEFWCWQ